MESRNPVFSNSQGFRRGGYATFSTPSATDLQGMYDAPSASPLQTGRMTLDDVVIRTASVFAVLVAAAATTYFVIKPQSFGLVLGAALAAMVVGLVVSFGKTVRPALILAYGVLEGVFAGGISYWYAQAFGTQIVPQAVLGTLVAFGTMLVLYKTGVVRNSPRFTKFLMIAGISYLVFGLVNLLFAVFAGSSVYDVGGLGLLISAAGVALASLFLVLDFDFVEQGIRNGLPRQYAWTAAFGLVVTLVWLYLEILRLLAILQNNR